MWKDLSLKEKAELMRIYVQHGLTSLDDIVNDYNSRHEDTHILEEGGGAGKKAAQDLEEQYKEKIEERFPVMQGYKYHVYPDESVSNGYGDIETFAGNWPKDTVHYNNGFNLGNRFPGETSIVFNPDKVTDEDVILDALHIAREQDPTYQRLLAAYEAEARKTDYGDFRGDGLEEDFHNGVDGVLRGSLYTGNRVKARYAPAEEYEQLYSEYPALGTAFHRLKHYLENGYSVEFPSDDTLLFKDGGSIHIKPENRGKFNELLTRTGKSASWFKKHGTPLQRKRATFALNARKWKHEDGGNLFVEGGDTDYTLTIPERSTLPEYDNGALLGVQFTPRRPEYVTVQPQKDIVKQPEVVVSQEVSRPIELKILGETDREANNSIAREVERLRKTLSKEQIIELQTKLKNEGYGEDLGTSGENKDGVDGIFGRGTAKALAKYYNKQRANQIDAIDEQEKYQNAVELYQNISFPEKVASMLTTTLPSHVGSFTNKVQAKIAGKLSGIENYDAFVGDLNQKAEERVSAATAAVKRNPSKKNKEELKAAKEEQANARKTLFTNPFNRKRLSIAEKKAVAAILTGINGDKPLTYEDYLNYVEMIGGEAGDILASNPKHKHKRTGKDVILYDNRSGYSVMNAAENARGGVHDIVGGEGVVPGVVNAEARIFNDPNRGRLGAFSWFMDADGNIHILDRLEATEETPLKGRNDTEQYNTARGFFPRSSTGTIRDVITAEQYRKWVGDNS